MLEFEKNALAANYEYQTHIKLGLQKNYEKIFKMTGWMTQSKNEKTKKTVKKASAGERQHPRRGCRQERSYSGKKL